MLMPLNGDRSARRKHGSCLRRLLEVNRRLCLQGEGKGSETVGPRAFEQGRDIFRTVLQQSHGRGNFRKIDVVEASVFRKVLREFVQGRQTALIGTAQGVRQRCRGKGVDRGVVCQRASGECRHLRTDSVASPRTGQRSQASRRRRSRRRQPKQRATPCSTEARAALSCPVLYSTSLTLRSTTKRFGCSLSDEAKRIQSASPVPKA